MKDLDKALADITADPQTSWRGEPSFRGYGSRHGRGDRAVGAACSWLQAILLPRSGRRAIRFILRYGPAWAALAVLITGAEMVARTRRNPGGLADESCMRRSSSSSLRASPESLLTVVLLSLRAAGPVDAARPVAGHFQPRGVRLARRRAARHVRGRRVVSGRRPCDLVAFRAARTFFSLAMALRSASDSLLMAFVIYRGDRSNDDQE